jgi:hypothetical protein
MKKLLLLTFILSPAASFAGDYLDRNADPVKTYEEILANGQAEAVADRVNGVRLHRIQQDHVMCFRDEVAGQFFNYQCFRFTEADRSK